MAEAYRVAVLGFHDGSAGQIETWFEAVTGHQIACFVHESADPLVVDVAAENAKRVTTRTEYPTPDSFKGRPLIVSTRWPEHLKDRGITHVLPLTPNNRQRLAQIQVCRQHGFALVSAIHPSVTILADATVEAGVWISAGSLIGYKAAIESGVIIHTRAQIDHHNVLKQCCQVDPGVVTAGNVTLRECSHVHSGATIINRVEVGEDAIVGAGSAVYNDIPANYTAVGVPARVILRGHK